MSNQASSVQKLPSEVVRLIIPYVDNGIKYTSSGPMDNLRELLSVCSTWRQTTLEYMWREIRLGVSDDKVRVSNIRAEWLERYWQPSKTEHMVRVLSINVPWASIFDGTAYKKLLDYMGETSSLPLVNKLYVWVIYEKDNFDNKNDSAIDNALMLTQFLRSLAPAATLVSVGYEVIFSHSEFEEKAVAEFTKSLYGNTQQTQLDLTEVYIDHTSFIGIIPPLTSLRVLCHSTKNVHMALIHKCASTLVELDTMTGMPKTLFYDADDNVVVYPNLIDFRLDIFPRIRSSDKEAIADIAPFPSLKKLKLKGMYPFADDVL
ncbi:hypothetical protein LPJ71_009502, partial [Coemansia sp. S17]